MKLRWLLFTVLCSLFPVLLFPKAAFAACWCVGGDTDACRCVGNSRGDPCTVQTTAEVAPGKTVQVCCSQPGETTNPFAVASPVCGSAVETAPDCSITKDQSQYICWGADFVNHNLPQANGEIDGNDLLGRVGESFNFNGVDYPVRRSAHYNYGVYVCGSGDFCCTRQDCAQPPPLDKPPQESYCQYLNPEPAGAENFCGWGSTYNSKTKGTGSSSGVKPTDSYDADTLCYERELINEPHPLRPAPGLVCSKEVPSPWNLSCANDVLPTLTVNLPRTTAGADCQASENIGRQKCKRIIKEWTAPPVNITIDLTNLELPIAGVASNTRVSDTLSDAQKMLNYTSWYLQGAVEQAEQEPLDYFSSADLHRILAYAGPLKKLIPKNVLDEKRKQLVTEAVNKKTYNQIIGYVKDNKVIGRLEAKQNLAGVTVVRLADMKDHLAPPWDDHDPEKQKWYTLWQQVPFASSGHVDVPGEVFPTACIRSQENPRRCKSDPSVLDARLEIISGVESFRVNFPHLVEDDTLLMQLLQDALISRDAQRFGDRSQFTSLAQNLTQATRKPEWTISDNGAYRNADGCIRDNALWNPGDNLEAAKNKTRGRIMGRLTFKKDINYEFEADTVASILSIRNCQAQGRTDCPNVLPDTVPVEITAPVPVHIRYSHMDEIGDRAVVGPGGIFKALYPDIPNTIGELINRPAESAIGYSCSAPDGCKTKSTNAKGQPRAFFPWWGTILDLFHTKIQQMLDPLRAVRTPIGGIGQGFSSSSPYASSDIQAALAAAADRHNIPLKLLQTIFEIEGTEFIASGICVESNKGAVGPMQITPGAVELVTGAGEENLFNRCNPGDAAELAARILKFKVGEFDPGNPTSGNISAADSDAVKRAAYGYYGSCKPDTVTERRWGEGIGYCDFVLYRMNLCPDLESSCDGE